MGFPRILDFSSRDDDRESGGFLDSNYVETGGDHMSARTFYILIGIFLAWALLVAAGGYGAGHSGKISTVGGIIVGALFAIFGGWLAQRDGAFASFVGLHLLAGGCGAVAGVILGSDALWHGTPPVDNPTLLKALLHAGIAVGALAAVGVLLPRMFEEDWLWMIAVVLAGAAVWGATRITTRGENVWQFHVLVGTVVAYFVAFRIHRAVTVRMNTVNAMHVASAFFIDIVLVFTLIVSSLRGNDSRSSGFGSDD